MPAWVYHLQNETEPNKTLCDKVATNRYRFTDINTVNSDDNELVIERLCPRCRAKALRMGLLTNPNLLDLRDEQGMVDDVSVKQHNNWLSRLGIY